MTNRRLGIIAFALWATGLGACGHDAASDAGDAGAAQTEVDSADVASTPRDASGTAADSFVVDLGGDPPLPCFIDGCMTGLACGADNVCRPACPDD